MEKPDSSVKGFFTTQLPNDTHLWTAGFFNERFPEVVSPLGWSVVRYLVEQTAFREPLRAVGYRWPADVPLTKLYRGHIYTNVEVFQRLYRIFPAGLVPRDAARYFPNRDLALRLAVPAPALRESVPAILHTLFTEAGWHPLNYQIWEAFVVSYDRQVTQCHAMVGGASHPSSLLPLIDRFMELSLQLLRLHRWSITYADVIYEVLQRLVATWVDADQAPALSAALISGLSNKSTEVDTALWQLAEQARRLDTSIQTCIQLADLEGLWAVLPATPAGRQFGRLFDRFLMLYGHRSPSLDLRYPTYRDEPEQVLHLVARLLENPGPAPEQRLCLQRERRENAWQQAIRALRYRPLRKRLFEIVGFLAQKYTVLRENQRFYWQKSMYGKRDAFCRIGRHLAEGAWFCQPEDIFFLTRAEVAGVVQNWLPPEEIRNLVQSRRAEFETLLGAPYPAFLQGSHPLAEHERVEKAPPTVLQGLPASPGRRRGPAVVLHGPTALREMPASIPADSILVASSTDPAWTPLFLRVQGLVLERGGVLSHGAVVAREYGLPAVIGVTEALDRIAHGQLIEVDGDRGTVTLLPS